MKDIALSFSTDDITIAEDGRIIITNPDVAKQLVQQLKEAVPDVQKAGFFDNCNCQIGHAAKVVEVSRAIPSQPVQMVLSGEQPRLMAMRASSIFDNCNCTIK